MRHVRFHFCAISRIWIHLDPHGSGGYGFADEVSKPTLRFNRDGILVFLPIVLVFLIALSFGAVVLAKSG